MINKPLFFFSNRTIKSNFRGHHYLQLLLLVGGTVLISLGLLIATFLVPIYEFVLKNGLKFDNNSGKTTIKDNW